MRVRFGERPEKRRWDERPVFAGLFVLLFGLAVWFPFQRNPYMCTFKQITGYPCFTCGMTRSWVHQVHGHFVDGILQSPLGSFFFFLALAFTLWTLARMAFRLPPLIFEFRPIEKQAMWAALVVALLANWTYSILTGVA